MSTPFDRPSSSIPVTIVTSDEVPEQPADVAVLRLSSARHEHAPGTTCASCAASGDIRAQLFDLLQQARNGTRPGFASVMIDAHLLRDPQAAIAQLYPHAPATGLRDHTVARSFHLSRVI